MEQAGVRACAAERAGERMDGAQRTHSPTWNSLPSGLKMVMCLRVCVRAWHGMAWRDDDGVVCAQSSGTRARGRTRAHPLSHVIKHMHTRTHARKRADAPVIARATGAHGVVCGKRGPERGLAPPSSFPPPPPCADVSSEGRGVMG